MAFPHSESVRLPFNYRRPSQCARFAFPYGSRWGLPSSRRFSSCMPGASDPDRLSGISPRQSFRSMFVFSVLCLVSRQCHNISTITLSYRFLYIGFRQVNTVATCSIIINEAESLQGGASPLWPTRFSVYASPLLFKLATVSIPFATLSARGATLDTGRWLNLTGNHSDPPPDQDLHLARSAKLCLAL
jgi:hypothetical protein